MGGAGGQGGATQCGGTNLLVDNFDDGLQGIDWYWSGDPGTNVFESNGEGVVELPANQPGNTYAAFQSARLYDLRNDSISVEVTQAANPAGTARTFLVAAYDDQNYLELSQRNGKLICARVVGGNLLIPANISYDAQAHRYWRLREDGTTTYWETSPDGVSYMVRAQTPTAQLFPLSSIRVDLGASLNNADPNPGEAHFEGLNGGGPSAGKWCPASSLTDDFDDGTRARAWQRFYVSPGCTLAETGGELVLTPPTNATGYCAYYSASSYDMTSSAIAVEVPLMVNTMSTAQVYLTAQAEDGGYVEIIQSNGTIQFIKNINGMTDTLGAAVYSPAVHKWWRIREQGGTTYWEYSANGVAWVIGAMEKPSPITMTAVSVSIGGGAYEALPSPGEVHFDNFNLPP
jgi:hypothetical protein